MTDTPHSRGQAVRAWREGQQARVSGRALAWRVGCDEAYLRRFENGTGDLSVPLATALCRETGIPIEILLAANQLATVRGAARLLEDRA